MGQLNLKYRIWNLNYSLLVNMGYSYLSNSQKQAAVSYFDFLTWSVIFASCSCHFISTPNAQEATSKSSCYVHLCWPLRGR